MKNDMVAQLRSSNEALEDKVNDLRNKVKLYFLKMIFFFFINKKNFQKR